MKINLNKFVLNAVDLATRKGSDILINESMYIQVNDLMDNNSEINGIRIFWHPHIPYGILHFGIYE